MQPAVNGTTVEILGAKFTFGSESLFQVILRTQGEHFKGYTPAAPVMSASEVAQSINEYAKRHLEYCSACQVAHVTRLTIESGYVLAIVMLQDHPSFALPTSEPEGPSFALLAFELANVPAGVPNSP